ncbi:DUF3467 domain-containing protein [Tunturiibacter lichenicola]|uniref:DUF3467 domain-containing protein n=1 Tax=Tunturiibacter lichenicola TaxID=2051959 RepID=UPI003D9B81D0
MTGIEARYSNHFEIGQNEYEFVLGFGQCCEDSEGPVVIHTRIVTNPVFAKQFFELLGLAIQHFEKEWGPLPSSKD